MNNNSEPVPTWTKSRKGEWLVRIPKQWWDNYCEAGENEFPVTTRNGEQQWVEISRASKPFTLDGVEYVLGTPVKETRTYRHYTKKRPAAHRCEQCGTTRNVHEAHDMSDITCWLCNRCDDGTASIC